MMTLAATPHSPNRKPRYRRPLRDHTRQAQKDAVITAFMEGHDQEGAAAVAMVSPALVARWEEGPEFREKAARAREIARLRAGGQLDDALQPLIERLVATLGGTENEKVAVEGILAVLRGRGVLEDRQQTEIRGAIAVGTADDWFRAYREARREFSEVGRESLGLPGGSGAGERPAAGLGGGLVPAVAPSPETPVAVPAK